MLLTTCTHHQLLEVLSAVYDASPILCSAALRTLHELTPFSETMTCCCSHAESIAILQLFISASLLKVYLLQ